jgi:hypothetical protein
VIIVDRPEGASVRGDARFARLAALTVALIGIAAAIYYATQGLTLSHYDAKGHLVVARRIADSLTPGWQQIGAVWLPLPHLLNFLPSQIDVFYRTGASAVAISIASFAIAAYAMSALLTGHTGSGVVAAAAVALMVGNPNTLYLQSTPMTEPLLIGLLLLAVLTVHHWVEHSQSDGDGRALRRAGIVLFLACWTRYEAWAVTGALLALAWMARVRGGERAAAAARAVARLATYPIAAGIVFVVISRVTVGEWFVSGGFFVAENRALGRPLLAAGQVLGGAVTIAGVPLGVVGCISAIAIAVVSLAHRARASMLLLLAPLAAAALPWYAFVQGHPYRVRYMVVHVVSFALVSGGAIGLLRNRRLAGIAAGLLVAATFLVRPPLDGTAAMVREAQWDRPNAAARSAGVTTYLRQHWDGQPIMASMGSLGHYMQELSEADIFIRDFLHEGNGELWKAALAAPSRHAKWMLVEEKAEGGDMLAQRAREDPEYLKGFSRAAYGGGVALYRRK